MFEVHMNTWCDGWTNTWYIIDENDIETPQTFETAEAAKAEINEFLEEILNEIRTGEREPDTGYSEEDFCIYDVKNEKYI